MKVDADVSDIVVVIKNGKKIGEFLAKECGELKIETLI